MAIQIPRRTLLKAVPAAAGASVLGFGWSRVAHAAREQVVVRIDQDIQNLDPANRIGTEEGNIISAVFRKLIKFKPGVLDWELDAAESITQVSDTVIEFTLKPGLQFHAGYGELTAEDVKFSFERFNPPEGEKAAYAADWDALDHVEVTGTHSGRLILKNPAPALWLIGLPDVSGAIVSKRAFEELGDGIRTKAIGAGPYWFAEWIPNQRIVLRADPSYPGPAPHFAEVVIVPIQEPQTAELAFRSGEIHFTKLDNPGSADTIAAEPEAKVVKQDSINYVWLGLNVSKAPLDSDAVRQAIRKGIDVDQVILAAYDGQVGRANALMAPGVLGYWADAPVVQRDPDAARALLEEAGFGGGLTLRLTFLNQPQYKAAAEVIQAQLAEIGIDLELEGLDAGAYWGLSETPAAAELDLVLQRFGGKSDPSFQTQWFTSDQAGVWNWQFWKNPDYDRLSAEAAATTDPDARAALYVQAQELLEASDAFVWLTHEVNIFASKTWLQPAILPNGDDWQYRDFTETA